MRATSSFKLSKPTKYVMATIVDAQRRNEFKRMMIEAELAAAVKISRREKADKDKADTND